MNQQSFSVSPIGRVQSRNGRFALKLDESFVPALRELDAFSHVVVLWWCHHLDEAQYRKLTLLDKPYRKAPDKVGVFATRSPVRPNPIAATTVAVEKVDHQQGIVQIPFIDAEDGSPVLDIKPYHPCTDRIKDVSVPAWCRHWPQWYEEAGQFDWAAEFVNAQ